MNRIICNSPSGWCQLSAPCQGNCLYAPPTPVKASAPVMDAKDCPGCGRLSGPLCAGCTFLAAPPSPAAGEQQPAFQQRVQPWMMACFGETISKDVIERNHRFLEESLELVQANGCSRSEAHQLVDYVFDRPAGEITQEVGGVMVTVAALCLATGVDMHACGEKELARIWTKVEAIRAKQAAKPKHSPLPAAPLSAPAAMQRALDALVAMQMEARARNCGLKCCDDSIVELRALLSSSTAVQPLSEEQMHSMAERWHDEDTLGGLDCDHRQLEITAFKAGARAIESAHGITKEPKA